MITALKWAAAPECAMKPDLKAFGSMKGAQHCERFMAGPVHYEVYIRKTAPAAWSLQVATEDRARAIQTAEEFLADNRAAAVRVTKETLDPDTMHFNSVTVLTRGAPEVKRPRVMADEDAPPRCGSPQDLYAPTSRELVGRVLEEWLSRQGVTAFELLHRPDLAEKLEASGVELQHAIQKVAVPESQISGQPVHDLVRHYQKLAERTIERLLLAGRREQFPDLENHSLADLAHRLAGQPERAFIMGGVVSRALTGVRGGRARLDRLMDMADRAPMDGPPHAMVLVALEQVMCEMFAARSNLADVLGPALDQGASLAAVVRMVAPREVAALIAQDARLALHVPVVEGPAARLGERVAAGQFPLLSAALARMVVRELMSPRRLRPNDAAGEIDILRTLAMTLTATAGRLLTLEEVQTAFNERSKALVTADFVAAYVKSCTTVLCEAEALTRLCENVTGMANKRASALAVGLRRFAAVRDRDADRLRPDPGPEAGRARRPQPGRARLRPDRSGRGRDRHLDRRGRGNRRGRGPDHHPAGALARAAAAEAGGAAAHGLGRYGPGGPGGGPRQG